MSGTQSKRVKPVKHSARDLSIFYENKYSGIPGDNQDLSGMMNASRPDETSRRR
jgi:hypothetical protein